MFLQDAVYHDHVAYLTWTHNEPTLFPCNPSHQRWHTLFLSVIKKIISPCNHWAASLQAPELLRGGISTIGNASLACWTYLQHTELVLSPPSVHFTLIKTVSDFSLLQHTRCKHILSDSVLVHPESDVYAFGILLSELFSRKEPYVGENPAEVCAVFIHVETDKYSIAKCFRMCNTIYCFDDWFSQSWLIDYHALDVRCFLQSLT